MSYQNQDQPVTAGAVSIIAIALIGVIALIALSVGGICYAVPQYRVYNQQKSGEAEFKRAEQNRRIAIEEARAELDAAELRQQADVIRAKGIAEANEIIGASITPQYIQWRWVEGLHDGNGEVIYIPTEANLPILEAGQRREEQP